MLHLAHNLPHLALHPPTPRRALIAIIRLARRGARPAPAATLAIASSLLLGVGATIIYDLWLGGIIAPGQMLLTCYWTAAVICFLKLLDLTFDSFARLFCHGRRIVETPLSSRSCRTGFAGRGSFSWSAFHI